MMKIKYRARLALVFSALLVTVCRCSFDRGTPAPIIFEDGTSMKCNQYIDYLPNWSSIYNSSSTYDCSLPCPDGSTVPFKEVSSPELMKAVAENGKVPTSVLQELQKQYCSATALIKATSTAAPTKTATPSLLAPVLTGEVTSCTSRAQYINLRLTQPPIDFSAVIVVVNINGVSVECVIPSDNKTILSCTLPKNLTFPAQIVVKVNGVQVNNFSVPSTTCVNAPSGSNGGPGVVPTATDFGG